MKYLTLNCGNVGTVHYILLMSHVLDVLQYLVG